MARGGKLNLNIDYVRLVNGHKAGLPPVDEPSASGDQTGVMNGRMVATAIVFFPAPTFLRLIRGEGITIPKKTQITCYTNGEINLDPTKFLAMSTNPSPPRTYIWERDGV